MVADELVLVDMKRRRIMGMRKKTMRWRKLTVEK
jgi:hypothetical protein